MQVSYLAALLGGAFTLFAPCAAMLLPAFFAYAFSTRGTLVARTSVFVCGILVAMVPLGAFAASLGFLIQEHRQMISLLMGILVIVFGILQIFSVSFSTPRIASRLMSGNTRPSRTEPTSLAVFALGLGYALAAVGCSGPILGTVLAFSTYSGSIAEGAVLMVLFGLGMGVPIGILAFLWDSLQLGSKAWLRPRSAAILGCHTTWQNIIAGLLFIILGVILACTGGSLNIPGILTATEQVSVESWIVRISAAVPSWLFFVFCAVFLVLIVVLVVERRRKGPSTQSR